MTRAAVELKIAEDSRMFGERASPNISKIVCYDRGYECPSGRPRESYPATYCASAPGFQLLQVPGGPPASPERAGSRCRAGTPILFALAALRSVPQAGPQFHGLAAKIHEVSGLVGSPPVFFLRWRFTFFLGNAP